MIKKLLTLLLVGSMSVSLTACLRSDPDYLKGMKESTAPTEVPSEERKWVLTDWSEEGLDELQAAVEKAGMPQLFGSERFDDGSFLNVTPKAIAEKTKIRVFKSVNENCSFLAMVDGQLYSIGKSGKYGFINAIPWDYNNDGEVDMIYSSSWTMSDDIHYAEISIFDARSRESFTVCKTITMPAYEPQIDIVISSKLPSSVKKDKNATQIAVYKAVIEPIEGNYAKLRLATDEYYGLITLEDGVPKFIKSSEQENTVVEAEEVTKAPTEPPTTAPPTQPPTQAETKAEEQSSGSRDEESYQEPEEESDVESYVEPEPPQESHAEPVVDSHPEQESKAEGGGE